MAYPQNIPWRGATRSRTHSNASTLFIAISLTGFFAETLARLLVL